VILREEDQICLWTKLRKGAREKGVEEEVERLVKIGAARYPWRYEPNHDYVVLEDPDGNLFCVVQV
jgi:hypothetical protein